ncbi:MAG: EAL domain-containing protein [Acidimicrobiales bacterium]
MPDSTAWRKLLRTVSASYTEADNDRYTLERSIDVSSEEMRALHAELSVQARHDALTGLPNRAALMEQLAVALAGARRLGHDVAILFIDLDGFKAVNDSLGHAAGDELLVRASERIRSVVRESDVVARLGGDEFVVLAVNGPEELNRATGAAMRIVATLENAFRLGAQDVYVSASVGVAWAAAGEVTADELLRRADLAMYQAKSRGRSQYVVFDEAMSASNEDRVLMEAALHRAVTEQLFELHYQPVFRLADHRVIGVEALVRWRRAGVGLVLPGAFLPVAESSRLIAAIGAWVVREACRQARLWGGDRPYVSVNLSQRELIHDDVVPSVAAALQQSGLGPHRLLLELTENTLHDSGDLCAQNLGRLRALGVRIGLDNFGTGRSSLLQLRRLPVEVLKIDRTLVADVDRDREAAAIVGAVINMAHALGMDVVATGVERPEQTHLLRELGCDAAQGFELAHPMGADQIRRVVREALAA